MATHSSILAWRLPWTEEPGGLHSMGVLKNQTLLSDSHTHTHTHTIIIHTEMAPKPEGVVSSPHTHSEARSPLTRQTQELTSEICHRKIERQNHCSVLTRSCPTLCDLMDYSPPGSSVHRDSPSKNTGEGFHALL